MATVEYHWVMTAQTKRGVTGTFSGLLMADHDATREGMYAHIRSIAIDELGADGLAILFYSAEPNAM